jgi:indolepyruvate ferredoxin oxidoreductase
MAAPRLLATASLDDRYTLQAGQAFLTGMQALVRLPIMQRLRDAAAGLNTGGYITGYRGSPLGGFDQALWQARKFIEQHHIVFRPAVNEDLAATALWGTQQLHVVPGAKYDGVFGMWYGKGPGVDRSGDAFKHANVNGTSRHGGVLALAGDDHHAKSSTVAHQSEFAFVDAMIPVVNPAGIQDILDYGLHAFAMSRFSGCWTGFKIVTELADSTATVLVDPARVSIALPTDVELPPGGLNLRFPDDFQEQERRLHQFKIPAALAYWRANALDRVMVGGAGARLGIVTAGKAYLDVRQAMEDLGIDDAEAQRLGLTVYKIGLTWPVEPQGLRRFAEGLQEILVVEEKRPLIEPQVKDLLFNLPADRRPRVIGKADESGAPLLPVTGEILPVRLARIIAQRLGIEHLPLPVARRLEKLTQQQAAQTSRNAPGLARPAYFCSGCPHNTSTRVPEGSLAMAGIGCHTMAMWMNRDTLSYTQMGGEGAPWVGMSPFSDTKHIFQNLGDGTYFHSGYLAIRQAVAAGTRITYKILFNDAVAMTGGQRHDGDLSPWKISRQVHAEGVRRIALVTDDPDKYPPGLDWAPGVSFHHRRELDAVQRDLRDYDGVSVLIYDQTCAAEKRRRRKRGAYPDPARRVFINQAVCEGCGDCSTKSNCLSVVPVETEFGRKRAIDQSSCNKDYSCLEGFCPSFVTIEGGRVRKGKSDAARPSDAGADWPALPEPTLPSVSDQPYGILVTGIGGTGVVTIGALLGTAANLDGYGASILDMIGMAQKGGAVMSHVRIAPSPEAIHAVRLGAAGAHLLLACDIAVASYPDALGKVEAGTTRALVNTHETITGDFTRNPDMAFPGQLLRLSIEAAAGADSCDFFDAQALATALLGDSIATNPFMLGYAWQKGLLPVSRAALERAIELNGAAVEMNKQAFLWGRRAAHDRRAVEALVRPTAAPEVAPQSRTLDEIVASRVRHLTGYQNAAYAERYRARVAKVSAAEAGRAPGAKGLAEAVARGYAKLLAYKDEYEVARLYSDGAFLEQVRRQFEGDYTIKYHLAPPLIADRDARTGHLQKRPFGPHMMTAFRILQRLKFLRGTRFDLFGRTAERRMERQLIADYEALIEEIIGKLSPSNHAIAVQLASLPDDIRGFGHVKDANVAKVRTRWAALLATFRNPEPLKQAAE